MGALLSKGRKNSNVMGVGRTERMPRRVGDGSAFTKHPQDKSNEVAVSYEKEDLLTESFRMNRRSQGSGSVWINSPSTKKRKRLRYASLTQRGYYPDDLQKSNQDKLSITHKFGGVEGDSFFAVYDGHGPMGHEFASYGKKHLPQLLTKYVRRERARLHKERNDAAPKEDFIPFNPKLWPQLNNEEYEKALTAAHIECNDAMIDSQPLVNLSGTTAISTAFHSGNLTVSNVGDSRCILGYCDSGAKGSPVLAIPLSRDQTPWRKDERERIQKAGGRVMTLDQKNGMETMDTDFGNRILGEGDDVDIEGDPPRVWLDDKDLPGTSFTRSLGDSIANRIGVCAEPEIFSKEISDQDEVLILASDGVFEFVPNQMVLDLCMKHKNNPIQACESVVDASFEKWLTYEDRTDDITVIVIFIDHEAEDTDD